MQTFTVVGRGDSIVQFCVVGIQGCFSYFYNEVREIIDENDESEPCLNMMNFNMGFTSYWTCSESFAFRTADFSFLTLERTLTATDIFLTLEIKMTNTEVAAAALSNTYI